MTERQPRLSRDAQEAMNGAKTNGVASHVDSSDSIIMSMQLKSGRFNTSLEMPADCTYEQREKVVLAWLEVMEAGVKCGR